MTAGKLIVQTNDLPYPPNYGHKVDQYHRWRGFAEHGWRLRLICWRSPNDPPVDAEDVSALSNIFEAIDTLPITHDLGSFARRIARLPRYPSHVSSRIPSRRRLAELIADARSFAPDAIVNDGIYGAAVGHAISQACGVPEILRGHNVEHRYFAQQAALASGLKARAALSVARLGLAKWEDKVTRNAAWSFQISADDVTFWQARGIDRLSWAPTVYDGVPHGTLIPAAERSFDVAYIGNMRLPNNLAGLRWFIEEVMPRLRVRCPGIRLSFAGANPSAEAIALFARAPEITLTPNAPSADAILSQGRVLVNPILHGSGVNVKSIDMLRYDAPIVTTSIGVQGFAKSMHAQFIVRNDAETFASAIADALANPAAPPGRTAARNKFGAAELTAQMEAYARVAAGGDGRLSST